MFLLNAAPQQRGLEPQSGPGDVRFWTFPPDYYARVIELMRGADPALSKIGR